MLDLLELIFERKVVMRAKEDNTATIKVLRKGCSAKLRHVLRTHKIDLGLIKDLLDDGIMDHLDHVEDEDCQPRSLTQNWTRNEKGGLCLGSKIYGSYGPSCG